MQTAMILRPTASSSSLPCPVSDGELEAWKSGLSRSGWSDPIQQALTSGPPDGKAELKRLVKAANAEHGLALFKKLPADPAQREEGIALFEEICTWRPGIGEFGWANALHAALGPRQPLSTGELKRLVKAANAEHGLALFKKLPADPAQREEGIALFEEICTWRPGIGEFGWANAVHAALDPRQPLSTGELKRLVKAANAEHGLALFKKLPADPAQREESILLFEEVCTWRPGIGEFGWANALHAALAPRQPLATGELKRLVKAANAEHGLALFKKLPADPAQREEGIALFEEICTWRPGIGEFGWANALHEHIRVSKEPELERAFLSHRVVQDGADSALRARKSLAAIDSPLLRELALRAGESDGELPALGAWLQSRLQAERLDPGQINERLQVLEPRRALRLLRELSHTDVPSLDQALSRLIPLCQHHELDAAEILQVVRMAGPPPGSAIDESEDRWLIGGVAIKKREN